MFSYLECLLHQLAPTCSSCSLYCIVCYSLLFALVKCFCRWGLDHLQALINSQSKQFQEKTPLGLKRRRQSDRLQCKNPDFTVVRIFFGARLIFRALFLNNSAAFIGKWFLRHGICFYEFLVNARLLRQMELSEISGYFQTLDTDKARKSWTEVCMYINETQCFGLETFLSLFVTSFA